MATFKAEIKAEVSSKKQKAKMKVSATAKVSSVGLVLRVLAIELIDLLRNILKSRTLLRKRQFFVFYGTI